jgi:hypothetical protein
MGNDECPIRVCDVLLCPCGVAGDGQFFEVVFLWESSVFGFSLFWDPSPMRDVKLNGRVKAGSVGSCPSS